MESRFYRGYGDNGCSRDRVSLGGLPVLFIIQQQASRARREMWHGADEKLHLCSFKGTSLHRFGLSKGFVHVYVNMDTHNQYMSSKQVKPIVNSHKYNLFGNNGHFYIKQQ